MARTKAKPKIDTAGGTQPAATSPDVVYGQGVENIAAQDPTQGGVALPDNRGIPTSTIQGSDGVVSASVGTPDEQALMAARNYNPLVTAMDAPDDFPDTDITAGLNRAVISERTLRQKRLATMSNMIISGLENSGDPRLEAIAKKAKLNGQI
tara:strand:+ start:3968 stop:4423 length:456 start_codon:yes stop_codon:yes gene_type:complete